MKDTEIIKALECCIAEDNCEECPLHLQDCLNVDLLKLALDLINRQKAEIERLNKLAELGNMRANDYRAMRDKYLNAKAEAYKEFAERLKDESEHFELEKENFVSENQIDNLLNELVGEDK